MASAKDNRFIPVFYWISVMEVSTMTEQPGKSTKLTEVVKEPGIADLPLRVRGPFAKAVIAERLGNTEDANIQLTKAVLDEGDVKP
jgi:hypothetical protein